MRTARLNSRRSLVQAMSADRQTLAHDKGNLSTSLKGLEAKGLVTIARPPGGKAEAVDLTPDRRKAGLPASGEL